LEAQRAARPDSLALLTAGISIEAKIMITAITTSISINVKAKRLFRLFMRAISFWNQLAP
jgi:hypothetical protein